MKGNDNGNGNHKLKERKNAYIVEEIYLSVQVLYIILIKNADIRLI